MPRRMFVFDPPDRFVAGTVGQPGQRTFFLQARKAGQVVSVVLEKVQVAVLAERLDALLDELESTGVAVPAEGQGRRPERLVDRLVERGGIGRDDLGRLGDSAGLELVEEDAEPLGEHGDLDLLEDDRDDLARTPGLEEERPVAGLADRAGHEPIGRVESKESSGHQWTLA